MPNQNQTDQKNVQPDDVVTLTMTRHTEAWLYFLMGMGVAGVSDPFRADAIEALNALRGHKIIYDPACTYKRPTYQEFTAALRQTGVSLIAIADMYTEANYAQAKHDLP